MNMQTAGLVFLFFLFLFKIYVFIIFKYTVAVFKHSRRGCQILENLNPSSCLHMMYINTASHILIKKLKYGSTERSQQLRTLSPLPENLCSITSIYMVAHFQFQGI